MKEHRKHTRIPLELTAEIEISHGTVHRGRTENISFGGAFFRISDLIQIKQGEQCSFSIILQEETERLSIDFNSEVVHVQSSGIGLRFISINGADAYNHFKKLMAMNSPAPDKLLDELAIHPGLILQGNQ